MDSTTLHIAKQLNFTEFPSLLREVPDAPKKLFVRGTLPGPEYVYLCVVGSRKISPYGIRACASLLQGLTGRPVAIISGLALGTDSLAHETALRAGLPTVAVLPSSLDDASIYPSTNKHLSMQILKAGGALVSEYAGPTKAHLYMFPARNRIMAGMSKATLVVEAGEKSGTLITARLALEYNREVLCVPHEIGRDSGIGTNRLIREGATLAQNTSDILEALGYAPEPKQTELFFDLSLHERLVYDALKHGIPREDISAHANLKAHEASIALSSLLIRGIIIERMGGIHIA